MDCRHRGVSLSVEWLPCTTSAGSRPAGEKREGRRTTAADGGDGGDRRRRDRGGKTTGPWHRRTGPRSPLPLARVVIRFWFGRRALRRTRIRFSLHQAGRFPARFASSFGEATAAASDLAAGPVGPNVRWAAGRKASFSSGDASRPVTAAECVCEPVYVGGRRRSTFSSSSLSCATARRYKNRQ